MRLSPSVLRQRAAATWEELAPGRVLPGAVRAELALEGGERVLSADTGPDGGRALVATDRALYHRSCREAEAEAAGWARLGWEEVAEVGWDAAAGQLIVIGVAGPARVVVPLRRRGSVPELAAERVTHTRLGRWQLRVGGTQRAVIEARRRPGTGELVWSVTCDGHSVGNGDGSGDQELRARADRAIARLSADLGAPPFPEE